MKKDETTRAEKEIEVLSGLSQKGGAWALQVSARTLRDSGIPRGKTGYHVHELAAWARRRAAAAGGGSLAAMREKLDAERLRKITLANDRTEGALVPKDHAREVIMLGASAIRGCGERLRREFGEKALAVLNECLDDLDGQCVREKAALEAEKRGTK